MFCSSTELHFSRRAAPRAASRPGGVLHSPHGPLHRPRRRARSPRLHVVLDRSVRRERPLNTLSSVVLTRDHQPTCSDHRHVLQLPLHHTPVLLCSFFVCLWPYLFVTILCVLLLLHLLLLRLPPQTSPASSLLPHTLSTLYLLPTQCSSSPGLQRGREKKKKMFVSVFIFLLSLFFLHKMNKVNIFYYTEQKKVFFFT